MSKAARTRERLQRVALDLFAQQGYEQTTVADVAAAAGVTPMTFFRHFGGKEGVVLDDPYDPLIAGLVAAQDPALPAVHRVRLGLVAAWSQMSAVEDDLVRIRLLVATREANLRAKVRENNARTEEAIVAALTADGLSRFPAVVATAAVMGALTAALFEWAQYDSAAPLGHYILAALDVVDAREPAVLP